MNLIEEAREVAAIESNLRLAQANVGLEKTARTAADTTLHRAQEAQQILQLLAQAVQQKAHERIAGVVTSCLEAVFDDPYEFKIDFERKRGKTEAVLKFSRRGLDVDPLTASGGGVVDVAAFALRASCLLLHRPRLSKVLVLDEPFRFVSAEYQPRIRDMLEALTKDLGLQIILVTHNETIATGKVIQL